MADDGGRRRGAILIIDGDPHLRDALARLLEGEGHRVLQAPDGPSALSMTRAQRPDLLLLDHVMPGVDGGAILRALRDELHDATPPALLMTGGRLHERAVQLGAVHGLEKPFNVPELLAAVAQHLETTKRTAS